MMIRIIWPKLLYNYLFLFSCFLSSLLVIGSRGGISPLRSHRTARESLPSHCLPASFGGDLLVGKSQDTNIHGCTYRHCRNNPGFSWYCCLSHLTDAYLYFPFSYFTHLSSRWLSWFQTTLSIPKFVVIVDDTSYPPILTCAEYGEIF